MKFKETLFDEYLYSNKIYNLHHELSNLIDSIPKDIENLPNLILYGPSGIGKYTQALKILSNFSPLKYEKKMAITFNKDTLFYKISDIHIEIDIDLLGCNSKLLWNSIYHQIIDIAASKKNNIYIVVCKNFHKINSELLEYFYSYMQNPLFSSIKIKYILITEQISFIPYNIISRCKVISIKRPTKTSLNSIKNVSNLKCSLNLKSSNNSSIELKNININRANEIYNLIKNKDFKLNALREILYKILIYNLEIFEIIWILLNKLYHHNYFLENEKKNNLKKELYIFFKFYNNNYRPIYHLEKFILYLFKNINE